MYQLGEFKLHILSDGLMRSDGGACFGVVPKVLWEKQIQADLQNRIILGLNCLLIQSRDSNTLIDAGIGDKLNDKIKDRIQITRKRSFFEQLENLNLKPEDIHKVILTHLHYDHTGHCTKFNTSNQLEITFPNALYYVQDEEWQAAQHPDARSKVGYFPENFLLLERENKLVLLNGDVEIIPGINVIKTGGHTAGHQVVTITSNGKSACFLGDLIPTSSHIKIPYIASHDLYPVNSMTMKEKILTRAMKENWLLFFEHSPNLVAGFLYKEEEKILVHKIMI